MSFARKCYVLVTMLALALPLAGRAQILINEIMAANTATAPLADIPDYFPDYVELYNFSTNDIDLFAEGWTLTDDVRFPTKFRFPPGSFIAADSFLLVFCDAETNLLGAAGTLHTGFNLDAKGGEILALYRTNVTLGTATFICSNQFGIQVPGYSVGRVPSGSGEPNSSANFTLNHPTPCGVPYPIPSQACLPNIAASFVPAPSSSNQFTLKINEWQATNSAGVDKDWVELYNPDTNVVELSGLVFTDNRVQLIGFIRAVPPLSYIAPQGYVQFFASDLASRDANHLDFSLSSGSDDPPPTPGNPLDRIFLFAPGRNIANVLDMVDCYLWRGRNLSEGRVPDGESRIIVFPNPTPEDSNFGRITNVVISELLSHTDPPLEDAVELHNPTTQPVDISYWWLSNSRGNPRKYQFPQGTVIQPMGYYVAYEHQFNNTNLNPTTAFTFNSARGDECYLFAGNSAGTITGFRTGVAFGPADNGVSFIRYVTSDTNVEFVASQDLSLGTPVRAGQPPELLPTFRTGQGAPNPPVLISPVVVNEVHYHPPDIRTPGVSTNDNADDEFVELRNIASTNVPLFYIPRDFGDPDELRMATNGWHLDGDARFDFPSFDSQLGITLLPNEYLLVVNFDPATNATSTAAWRARFGVPGGVRMVGPYRGRLSNNSGAVRLERPDRPQTRERVDAGLVPEVLVDRMVYNDRSPWPTNGVDGGGNSLQRRFSYEYGNDSANWFGAAPTPGRYNSPSGLEAPYILVQPQSAGLVEPRVNIRFTCLARGDGPLTYRWHRDGIFTGQTGTNLVLNNVGSMVVGDYTCVISNVAGISRSQVARLDVNCPFFLNHSLAGFPIAGGSSNIVVSGTNGCEWTVENVPDWITITSGPTYNGSGIVTYTVAPNNLGLRSVTLLVAGLPYVIGQTPGDLIRPTVSVTAPATGARLTSSQVLVRGTANDNVKIGSLAGAVTVEVVGGSTRQIDGSNVWSTLVSLPAPGTNWIRVYSQDFAGNYSATNTRTVFYAVSAPLLLDTSGAGRVTGATNFQRLEIGRNYTLTATPAAGHVFSYWSRQGIPISHSNRLTFRMEAGLQIGAHFVPSPYGAVRGTYDGLFLTPGDVHHTNAGSFKMITTDRGTYTVTIQLAGKRYAASGQFLINASGGSLPSATNVIARPGLTPLTVAWYLDLATWPGFGSDTVTGWMSMQESAFPVNVIGNRAIYHAVTNRAPLAGKYTLVIPGAPGATGRPQGDGFGTLTIAPSGILTFSGTLADGTPVTHSAPVSKNGEWPLNAPLHAGKGSLLGWVYFATNDPQTDLFGDVIWTRPALATTPFYRPGFEASTRLIGSRYVAPVGATSRILAITNGLVIVTGGNLSQTYTNDVILGLGSRVTNASPNRLTLTFAPATGLFTGSFTPAGTTRAYALRGVALQKTNFASGFFLGTNEVGRVSFEPVPPPPLE